MTASDRVDTTDGPADPGRMDAAIAGGLEEEREPQSGEKLGRIDRWMGEAMAGPRANGERAEAAHRIATAASARSTRPAAPEAAVPDPPAPNGAVSSAWLAAARSTPAAANAVVSEAAVAAGFGAA